MANLLDKRFKILNVRFGLDPILGLFPGIGDFISLCLSLYIIWIAVRMKLPEQKISKMMSNILFDFVLGLVPVIGDIGDFFYRANSRNLAILLQHTREHPIVDAEIVK